MGVDIHMHIMDSAGFLVKQDIFTDRNRDWFNNISGEGYDPCYNDFPSIAGIP